MSTHSRKPSIASWPVVALWVCGGAAAQGAPDWKATDGFPGVQTFANVYALTVWDPDGSGPQAARLVAGGDFQFIADRVADTVAAFHPELGRFEDLGGGLDMMLPGQGGGLFDAATVNALGTFQNDLIVAGFFDDAGGVPVSNIARWNGSSWSSLGSGLAGFAEAMTTFHGELIVAGTFASAGGVAVNNIARWNGATWQPLGSPAGMNGPVFGVAVYNGELVAVGEFTSAGGAPANRIARWNGAQWQALGSGLDDGAYGLAVLGSDLYVGGDFTLAGGVPQTRGVARWDGASWHPVAGGAFVGVSDLVVYQGELVAGGVFIVDAVGGQARQIARLDGATQTWHTMEGGFNVGAGPSALVVYGDELVAAGGFSKAGNRTVRGIARWIGAAQTWDAIAPGFNITPSHFITYRDELIAGGGFQSAGNGNANGVARWDGDQWHPLGSGIHDGDPNAAGIPSVFSLGLFNDDLIVGGHFFNAGGAAVHHIAAWNGATQTWSDVGGGVSGVELPRVNALAVYNGELIAGGDFATAGGVPAASIARWNGSQWQPLAGGYGGIVNAMIVFGGDLIVTGSGLSGMQRWDGAAWHAVTNGPNGFSLTTFNGQLVSGFLDPFVWNGTTWTKLAGWSWDPNGAAAGIFEMTAFQNELIVAGQFENAAGIPEADGLARFDGTTWRSMATAQGTPASITSAMWVHHGELITNGRVIHPDGAVSNWRRWGAPAAGVSAYGIGTPGCAGLHVLGAPTSPTVGDAQFQLTCDHAPPSALGLVLAGDAAEIAGADPFGIGLVLHVSLGSTQLFTFDMQSDSFGDAAASLPIPPTPSLVGLTFYAQALWHWPQSACAPSLFGLSSSNGLALTIQS